MWYMTKIETIYQLADIHIKNDRERHEEYKKIFEKVYKQLKEDKREKLIVICGDLVHDKNSTKSDASILASDFLYKLSEISKVIIFDGNHDISIDDSRASEIKRILTNHENKNKISYLDKSGEYEIEGINFILTHTNAHEVTKITEKKNMLNIGLYHGSLYASILPNGTNMRESKFKLQDFKNYDITMLGDIHLYQEFKYKNVVYSGSLIQQGYGEYTENHGMVKWNVQTKTHEFIPILNDNCYVNCKMIGTDIKILNYNKENNENNENIKIDLLKYKTINMIVEFDLIDTNKQDECKKKIIEQYKDKIHEPHFELNINSIMLNANEKNTHKCKDIYEIHNEYIDKMDITIEQKKICKERITIIITECMQRISSIETNTQKKLELIEMEFENIFCYGEKNKIVFENKKGIIGIMGENGEGKSSINHILLYVLYNEWGVGLRPGQPQNKHVKDKEGWIKIKFKVNNDIYEIEKILREKKNLTIKKNNILVPNDGRTELLQYVASLIGTFSEITDTNILLQNNINFIDRTPREKENHLGKILNLIIYDSIKKNISDKITNKEKEIIKTLSIETENIKKEELIKIKQNLEKQSKELEKQNIEQNKIIKYELELTIGDEKLKKIPKNIKLLIQEKTNKINELKKLECKITQEDINELKLQLSILNNKMENVENEKYVNITENEQELNENYIKIKEKIAKHEKILLYKISKEEYEKRILNMKNNKNELKLIEKKNESLLKLKFNDTCNCCNMNTKIISENTEICRIEELNKNIIENENIESKYNLFMLYNKKNELKTQIKIYNEKIKIESNNMKIENKKNKLKTQIKILNDNINDHETKYYEYTNLQKILNELTNDIILLNENLIDKNNIENKQQILNTNIKDKYKILTEIKNTNKIIDELKIKMYVLEKELNDNTTYAKKNIEHIKEKDVYEILEKLYTNIKIKENVMREKLNQLELLTNNVLTKMTDFKIKFEKETIGYSIDIIRKNDIISAMCTSGYEKFACNISLHMAMTQINSYLKSDFLIIDEGFSTISKKNLVKINDVFDVLKKNYKWCFVISHIDEIKNNYDTSYTICRDSSGNSHINI